MSQDNINYEKMVEEALRGVVLNTLQSVAENGLPIGHHLYISFLTRFPGVKIPDDLQNQFPDEMTIVLQNQFWNLEVTDTDFRVTLNFKKVQQELIIPAHALTGFADPYSEFSLQFGNGDSKQASGKNTANSRPSNSEEDKVDENIVPPTEKIIKLDSFRKP
tara:strand:+ start:357 stop:842 length:486 start_codon:yes stop_codon:yes gene_type:complete